MKTATRVVVLCAWAAWCRREATTVRLELGSGHVVSVCSDHAGEPTW